MQVEQVELADISREAEAAVAALETATAEPGTAVILDNLALGEPDVSMDGTREAPTHAHAVTLSQWRLRACNSIKFSFKRQMRHDLFGRRNSETRQEIAAEAKRQSQQSLQAIRRSQ